MEEGRALDILAIIPARGGSKGVPLKNIWPIIGKPLLAYTIEQAQQSSKINRIVVSTDNAEIAAVAEQNGAQVVERPLDLSGDAATSESALLHALDYLEASEGYMPDLVVFLQCTSPIRRHGDIDGAITAFMEDNADSLLSVVPFHLFVWTTLDGRVQSLDYDYRHRPRRQERQPEFLENGSIYIFKPWVLRRFQNRLGGKIAIYEMDEWSSIDINSPRDLELCEWVLEKQHRPGHIFNGAS